MLPCPPSLPPLLLALGAAGAPASEGATPVSADARAEAEGARANAPWAALELRSGVALRADRVQAPGLDARATGLAPASFALGARAFVPDAAWGAALVGSFERFGLTPEPDAQVMPGPTLRALELELAALALGRGQIEAGRLSIALEGGVGWGLSRRPVAAWARGAGAPRLAAAALESHGPVLAARATVPLWRALAFELGGRARPLSLGATYEGGAVAARALAAEAAVAFGRIEAGAVQLSALVAYEFARVAGDEPGLRLSQTQHRLGLGLRAALGGGASAAASVLAAAARAGAPGTAAPVAGGRLRGIVREAPERAGEPPGPPLVRVSVEAEGGARAVSADDGSFELAELPPGPLRLRLQAAGFTASDEVVAVAARGETRASFMLRRLEAPATVTGLVRAESGPRLAARVTVVERQEAVRADARGAFALQLPPGAYTLLIEAPGFVPQRKSVAVGSGEQSIYNVDLRRER